MREIITKVYKFDELSNEVKEKVLENFWDINIDHEWYDVIFEYVTTIGKLIGIKIDKIYFSISDQRGSACFDDTYSYQKNSVKKVKEYASQDAELHEIVTSLHKLQSNHFFKLKADIINNTQKHLCSINYSNIVVFKDDGFVSQCVWESFKEILRDFTNWIYGCLKKDYDYLTSKKCIEETIKENEYEFTVDGKLI